MRSLVLLGPRSLALEETGVPEAAPGEVVVRVASCGICGSDVHSYAGRHPFVIYPVVQGHEFSGTVESVGEGVSEDLLGGRVVVEPSLACGRCRQCLSGRYNICTGLRVMGFQAPGAMCEYIAVPEERLHPLPDRVSLTEGALVEPCAVAVHAFARSGVSPGEAIAVIGAGVIGSMIIKVAKACGCTVVALESDEGRAQRAAGMGADAALVSATVSADDVAGVAGGEVAAVFECVGDGRTLARAIEIAPRGSTVVVVGVFAGPVPVEAALIQDGELDLKGTLMYRGEDFRRAIDLMSDRALDVSGFVSRSVSLEGVEEAYRLLLEPASDLMKVIVEPGG
ncbi:MAG: alcohol dehydrogenase catalytic domain-containing protein [Actinomycetota bacterium]